VKTAYFGRALLARIAWLAFAMGGARGASIIETVPFTILAPAAANLPPQTVNVPTPQFNPSLGTLESATTSITGTISTALEFFNTGASGPYDIFLTGTLSLAGIPGLFGQELTGIVPADQAVFTSPTTFPFGPVYRGDPAELVVCSGSWNQLFSLPFPFFTIKHSPAPVLVLGMSITGSSVTTYTYTPVTAAAPESRFLFVPALLFASVLEAWNRRRKRVKALGQSMAGRSSALAV
jgi:hypothetical protein